MSHGQSNGLFVKIAVFIVGIALPLSIAAPASAAVTTSRAVEQELATLDVTVDELRQRFAEVDPGLVDELDNQLTELRSYGLGLQDLDSLAAGETVNGVNPSLLSGLLDTILELVYSLLESLGLTDSLPEIPELPDLPTAQQAQSLGLLGGGLVDNLLGQVDDVSAGLGLTGEPVGLSVLQDLIDTLLAMVFDLLLSLGLIELPDIPELPDVPDVPDVPAGDSSADSASSPIDVVLNG